MNSARESIFLTVAMPAYNEASNLPRNLPVLIDRLSRVVSSFEIVIVDDASTDETGTIAEELAASDPRVVVRHHPANLGIGGGFMTALGAARGEFFILIPADLALDLGELPKYLEAAAHCDVVVGLRSNRSDYSLSRKVVSFVNIALIRLLLGARQRQFNYISCYRTQVLRDIKIQYTRSALFFAEIIVKVADRGGRISEVEISYVPREIGQQTGANPRLIRRTLRDLLDFWWSRRG